MLKSQLLKFFYLFLTTSFLISCGNKEGGTSKVRIKMPKQLSSQKLNSSFGILDRREAQSQAPGGISILSDIWAPSFAPTNTAELNCFGVAIGGPEDNLSTNFCEKTEGGDINFGVSSFGALPEELITVEVDSGDAREITILAWQAENAEACQSLIAGTDVESRQLSHPFIIASQTQDLEAGEQILNINASLTDAKEIINCDNLEAKPGSLSTRLFTIGGTINNNKFPGVPGNNLQLSLNGVTPEDIDGDGQGELDNLVGDLVEYDVTITQQPAGKTCTIENGTGVVNGANITDIVVNCEDIEFTVGGNLSGFVDHGEGETLVLKQEFTGFNGFDESDLAAFNEEGFDGGSSQTTTTSGPTPDFISLTQDGIFTFSETRFHNQEIKVSIESQPLGQTCTLSINDNEESTPVQEGFVVDVVINDANIENLEVNCVTNTFPVGGVLAGLIPGRSITLENQAYTEQTGEGEFITLTADGGYQFTELLPFNDNFNVSIVTQPAGQTCTIENNTGFVTAAVTNVNITCVPNLITIGGNISGLINGRTLFMNLNVPSFFSQNKGFNANGSYTFESKVPSGETFNSNITSQPVGQTCTLNGGTTATGTAFDSDILDLSVVCTPNNFTLGGAVTGLVSGSTVEVTISTSQGNSLNFDLENESFTSDPIPSGTTYTASVVQPEGHTCSVANASGEVLGSNITNINVTCTPSSLAVNVATTFNNDIENIVGLSSLLEDAISESYSINDVIVDSTTTDLPNLKINAVMENLLTFGDDLDLSISPDLPGYNCSIGTATGATAVEIPVSCSVIPRNLLANVSGLATGGTLIVRATLETPGQNFSTTLSFTSNETQTFGGTFGIQESLAITIDQQPVGQICTVEDSPIVFEESNETASITCIAETFSIGGSINGLADGESVIISNNEVDNLTINGPAGDGSTFTFAQEVSSGTSYNVFIFEQPSSQTCTITNANGTATADVTNIVVDCEDNAVIASGTFDSTFNLNTGQVEVDTTSDDILPQIELDSQNRLNVSFQSFSSRISMCRFDTDGRPDASFNSGSCAQVLDLGGTTGLTPNAMALDSSDQMVIGGAMSNGAMFVTNILADGSGIDTANFSGSGAQGHTPVTNSCGAAPDEIRAMTIDNNGNIYAAGVSQNAGNNAHAWWKLNSDGGLNQTFDNNGIIPGISCANESTTDPEEVEATIVDSSGRLISVGTITGAVSGNLDFKLVGLSTTTGGPDASFGSAGVVTLDIGSNDTPTTMIEDSNGRIYVAGQGNATSDGIIVRFLANGTLDTTFATSGILTFNQGGNEIIEKILFDDAGNILAAGFNSTTNTGFIARFDSDGNIDTSFATNGVLTRLNVLFEDMVIDDQGNIYAAGRHDNGGGNVNMIILKVN